MVCLKRCILSSLLLLGLGILLPTTWHSRCIGGQTLTLCWLWSEHALNRIFDFSADAKAFKASVCFGGKNPMLLPLNSYRVEVGIEILCQISWLCQVFIFYEMLCCFLGCDIIRYWQIFNHRPVIGDESCASTVVAWNIFDCFSGTKQSLFAWCRIR